MSNTKCYLFFSGYYVVSTASQLLAEHHINNRIVRAPVYLRNSCNFAVLIDGADTEKSMTLLRQEKITVEKKTYTTKNL